MKALSDLLPPSESLDRVERLDEALRKARRLGLVGWGAFAVASVQLVLLLISSNLWGALRGGNWAHWPLVVAAFVLGFSLLLINWTRFWLRLSKQPFHYTFSIGEFQPVEDQKSSDDEEPEPSASIERSFRWLQHDLKERLSRRVGRLALLDEDELRLVPNLESHLHIAGSYGIRRRDGMPVVEVLPWVRLGQPGSSAALAHLVKFSLASDAEELSQDDYEKLVERVYFSVATRVYQQIRKDVERKIELLPSRYYRATAFFYEAEDYGNSNTLDAYDGARALYRRVLELYDPSRWRAAGAEGHRLLDVIRAAVLKQSLRWRRAAAKHVPRFGSLELMLAKAELGYARTLIYRRALAGMSGQRLNPVYETRPVALWALQRLEALPKDLPGRSETMFDALVALAAAYRFLGDAEEAKKQLERATRLDPRRADSDSAHFWVRGQLESPGLEFLRQAVELDPKFEAAQFALALEMELYRWRSRPTLESSVAEMVLDEYEKVLTIDPGNIGAWANCGYIKWLLEDLEGAEQAFHRGRDYKEIKPETFVSELDYGLARIAAEQGDFDAAYRHYITAVSAHFAQGVSHAPGGYTAYHFALISRTMIRRFETYRSAVCDKWEELVRTGASVPSPRIRDSVFSFVLNDYGEACFNYFQRSGDRRFLELASETLHQAADNLRTRFPMIHFNLYRIHRWLSEQPGDQAELEEHLAAADRHIERVVAFEPHWPDGRLELALWKAERATRDRVRAEDLEEEVRTREASAVELRKQIEDREREARAVQQPEKEKVAYLSALRASPEADIRLTVRAAPHDLQKELDELRQRESSLQDRVGELKAEARRLRRRAEETEGGAAREPAKLIPHEWLRRKGNADDLDWSVLGSRDYRLERELDDVHVGALQVWCRLQLRRADAELHKRLDPLLDRLVTAFSPGDIELLSDCRRFWKGDQERVDRLTSRIRGLFERYVARDPSWAALTWVIPREAEGDLFSHEQAAKALRRARHVRPLPELVSVWLIGQISRLAEKIEADDLVEASRAQVGERQEQAGSSTDPEVLFQLGETLYEHDMLSESLCAYERGIGGVVDPVDEAARRPVRSEVDYRRKIALVKMRLGRHPDAVEEVKRIDRMPGGSTAAWRTELVADLLAGGWIDDSPEAYRLLKDWLGALVASSSNDEVREDAADALLRLTVERYQVLIRRRDGDEFPDLARALTPTVTPVVLEAGDALFPEGDQLAEVQRMLEPRDGDLASMRRRIMAATGVEVPLPSLRGSILLSGLEYRVLVDEVPVAGDAFGPEWLFLTDSSAYPMLKGRPGLNPATGREGLWLADDAKLAPGTETWDRCAYMARHVEAVLMENLARVVGIQEVEALLAGWENDPNLSPEEWKSRREWRKSELPDRETRIRLAAVVHALVRERVPIKDFGAILAAFVDLPVEERGTIEGVERVRQALGTHLPTSRASTRLVPLPAEIEDSLAAKLDSNGGRPFLSFGRGELDGVLDSLDVLLRDVDETRSALLVHAPTLRPFVRCLLESRHPMVAVVSAADVPEYRLHATREYLG